MVDRSNLAEAARLNQEAGNLQGWLNLINAGATITAVIFTPSDAEPDAGFPPRGSVAIPTAGVAYPPQMIAGIKEQLQKRYDEIIKQLSELGVGVDQPEARKAKK